MLVWGNFSEGKNYMWLRICSNPLFVFFFFCSVSYHNEHKCMCRLLLWAFWLKQAKSKATDVPMYFRKLIFVLYFYSLTIVVHPSLTITLSSLELSVWKVGIGSFLLNSCNITGEKEMVLRNYISTEIARSSSFVSIHLPDWRAVCRLQRKKKKHHFPRACQEKGKICRPQHHLIGAVRRCPTH